jgi:hypothetical protein
VWAAVALGCGRVSFDALPGGDLDASGDGSAAGDAGDAGNGERPADFRGAPLLEDGLDDLGFAARGWYDGTGPVISTAEHAPGSTASFECTLPAGQSVCGAPGRYLFPATESVFASYWVKRSPNFTRAIELYFFSQHDGIYTSPTDVHLGIRLRQDSGTVGVFVSDQLHVDTGCVRLAAGGIVGCGGDFTTYTFGEDRSVSGCNGLDDQPSGWECFQLSPGRYWSEKAWTGVAFSDQPGPNYTADWHLIEVYLRVNDVVGGVGVPNGRLRYWRDGELILGDDAVLFRTGAYPDLAFNQLMLRPFAAQPVAADERLWLDELVIARGVP